MFFIFLSLLGLNIGSLSVNPVFKPETLHYNLVMKGTESGTAVYTVIKEKFKGKDAIRIQNLMSSGRGAGAFYDTLTLYIDPKDFIPIYLDRTMRGKFNLRVTAEYTKKKVKVHLVSDNGKKDFEIDNPKGGLDNDEIIYLLRWIDLKKGPKKGTIKDISAIAGRTVDVKWEYKGDTTLTINNKSFDAYRVDLNFMGQHVLMFFEKNMPRRMLQYIAKESGTKMTLKVD